LDPVIVVASGQAEQKVTRTTHNSIDVRGIPKDHLYAASVENHSRARTPENCNPVDPKRPNFAALAKTLVREGCSPGSL
jgi:hypothetical protein